MDAFAGAEPLVGEVRALRTFRVEQSGLLLPLYSEQPWQDGTNTARCPRDAHTAPADGCDCGFYAYGTVQAAAHARPTRYVQAVVSCWGGVVAGTQGVRAQHARVEAVWLHPAAPGWLRRRVAARYPTARLYDTVEQMLAAHPLSVLPSYDGARPRRHSRLAAGAAVAGSLALGALPAGVLRHSPLLWDVWLAAVVALALAVVGLAVAARFPGHLVAAGISLGLLAWAVSPLLGLGGWLLRLPVLRGVLVAVGGYLMTLRPRYFPVVVPVRERTYYGARV